VNKSERRKQNQMNAKHSKGPTSELGKARSRQNALTHGYCAVELSLPIENPETLQAEADAWFEDLDPVGHKEIDLANQAALASLKLKRFAKSEAAIVADQVRAAELTWDLDRDRKFHDLKTRFNKEPGTVQIELRSIGKGVAWLLDEWITLDHAFEAADCWTHMELIRHALRLQGFDPTSMAIETDAQEFVARAAACIADPEKSVAIQLEIARDCLLTHRYKECHKEWQSYDRAESIAVIRGVIVDEIRYLMRLDESLKASEAASRASATVRAMVPEDTHENRLILRYARSTASDLDRTLKTLVKLQQVRRETAEREAEEADFRNEPEEGPESSTKPIRVGNWVTVNGTKYQVYEKTDGCLSMTREGYMPQKYEWVDTTVVPEVDPTPLNGV
jgi:hypothetical protein